MAVCMVVGTSCGKTTVQEKSDSLNDIQTIVRETQEAFESGNAKETQKGISKLVELSEDPLYSESERIIAQYCATYINAGVMLDYIIRNDNQWLNTHDVAEFDVFYGGIFVEVINGEITHIDTLEEYYAGLVNSTREIYLRYTELKGK